jgi:hypothetical protein
MDIIYYINNTAKALLPENAARPLLQDTRIQGTIARDFLPDYYRYCRGISARELIPGN